MQQGEVFAGRYRVERELGRGGMGVVYAAVDVNLDRQVALKVVARSARGADAAAARFKREAVALAAVHHPGVVTVFDSGEWQGELYLVMRLVDGSDLGKRLSGHRRLSLERTASLVTDLAAALDALHRAGLVHRDVKPSNVLLEGERQAPVLCDFGLAKPAGLADGVTATGQTAGTVLYMSPEQLSGDPATPASDVYALGCVVFHCLTGRPPFTGHDEHEVAVAHREQPVPDVRALLPDAPAAVQDVLVRCLHKQPARRYASAGEAARALSAALGDQELPQQKTVLQGTVRHDTVVLPRPAPVPQPEPRVLPRGLLAGCAAVVALAAVGGLLLGMRPSGAGGQIGGTTTDAAAALDADHQRLAALLSEDYGDCAPLPRQSGELAKLNCARTPDGIATLHAVQWPDAAAMGAFFRRSYASRYTRKPCSEFHGGAAAARSGHVSSWPGVGGIACYVNVNEDAVLMWQDDARALQLLAIRDDADSDALFAWWQQNREGVAPAR